MGSQTDLVIYIFRMEKKFNKFSFLNPHDIPVFLIPVFKINISSLSILKLIKYLFDKPARLSWNLYIEAIKTSKDKNKFLAKRIIFQI